jgi:hypothetical protein
VNIVLSSSIFYYFNKKLNLDLLPDFKNALFQLTKFLCVFSILSIKKDGNIFGFFFCEYLCNIFIILFGGKVTHIQIFSNSILNHSSFLSSFA